MDLTKTNVDADPDGMEVDEHWKCVRYRDGAELLCDCQADPHDLRNRAADSACEEVLATRRLALLAAMQDITWPRADPGCLDRERPVRASAPGTGRGVVEAQKMVGHACLEEMSGATTRGLRPCGRSACEPAYPPGLVGLLG
jgi:hypothetical protein